MAALPTLIRLRLRLFRTLATLWIIVEVLLASLSAFLLWICGYFILWLLQIPSMFGQRVEITTAIVFVTGFVFLLQRGMAGFHLPHRHDVTRRIEDDSGLIHRPLSGLNDRLANPDADRTQGLWSAWQDRLLPSLKELRWPRPRAVLPGLDPFAVRGLALIGLIVVVIIAGPAWRQRIGHGLLPAMPAFAQNKTDSIILWITPPAYTGQPQIVLNGSTDKTISIPEGSLIKVRLKGWLGHPAFRFDDHPIAMDDLGDGNYGLEKTAQAAKNLSIRQFLRTRAQWPVNYIVDQPPVLTQKGPPQIQPKGAVKIPLSVKDDYGIETVTAHIVLAPDMVAPPLGTPVDDVRNIVSPPKTVMDFAPEFDLAWHPWAGMRVMMDIAAKDHKGQVARIEKLTLTLPERHFRHPLAQKLIQMRKRLIWSPESAADNVAHEVEAIMARPALYQGDHKIFLSLRSIASHLVYKNDPTEVAKVVAQIWDTTLRIEDGNFTMAQRDLRKAQQDLQNALHDPNATPEQIATLVDNLRQAMGQYLNETFREMQKQMAQSGADPSMLSAEKFLQALNPDALLAMLDKMQAQAMSGDRNAAQQMLSQMEKMMDSLDPSNMQTEMPQDMQAMAKQIGELQKLVDAQKALLAKTEKTDPKSSQAEQENLRQNLIKLTEEAAEKLNKVPENMGKGELQMRKSGEALAAGKAKDSMPFQEQAIKELGEAQKQMSQQLAERMAQMVMFSFGQGKTDPLGRPMREDDNGEKGDASKVKIPDQAERKKIQDILDQLRKKSGELARPEYELDYYRRLMKQF